MNSKPRYPRVALLLPLIALATASFAADLPTPLGIPAPGPTTDQPYAPQPILQGGMVIPLYPEGSPFFYNYGVNTVILRNRLRKDGYVAERDAVNDALQAIRTVRAHAKDFRIDPNRIGIMGFSAGAELSAPAAVFFEEWDKTNSVTE